MAGSPPTTAGCLDDGGFLYVEGRLDDVIVRGGENISPGEIEDVLLEHPSVAEAAVVGVPDDEWGEEVAAAVVLVEHGRVTTARAAGLGPCARFAPPGGLRKFMFARSSRTTRRGSCCGVS